MARTSRRYDNSRRAAQAGGTRERILDAAIALIASADLDVSIPRIAAQAGVAAPTVYKHFPNREAIFDAVQARINERFGRPAWPTTADAIRANVPPLHRFFAAHATLVRAAVTAPALRPFWDLTRRRRDEALRRALRPLTRHLTKDRAVAAAAMVARVVGVECWLELSDRWHLPHDTITAVTLETLDALLSTLEQGNPHGR